jgi:hypothetical protein
MSVKKKEDGENGDILAISFQLLKKKEPRTAAGETQFNIKPSTVNL